MSPPLPPEVLHPMALLVLVERGTFGPRTLAGHEKDLALASDPMATGEALDKLARKTIKGFGSDWSWIDPEGEEWTILTTIAKNPAISKETTKRLLWVGEESDTLNRSIAEALGVNPSRLIGRLEDPIFSADVDRYVAFFTTNQDSLRELAFHQSSEVREGVAHNPNTPADLVEMLARDPDAQVRYHASRDDKLGAERSDLEIASDPTTPSDKLQELSFGHDRQVRLAVARNPMTSPYNLWYLASHYDKDQELINLAGKNPSRLLHRLTLDEDQKLLDQHLAQKSTDPDVLRELFGVSMGWILEDLANNRHTPVDVLEAILKQGDPDNSYRVAQFVDKLTPLGKRLILDHPDLGVRERAVDKSEDPAFIHELVVAEKLKEPRREEFVWTAMDNRRKSQETRDFLVAWSEEIDDA